jgi:hypothetical protein
MLHRSSSGEIIFPPKLKSQDTAQTETGNSGLYKFELLPSFPRTLFDFKKYDGAKTLTAFLLILATFYFLIGFLGFAVDHTAWLQELLHKPPIPETYPKPYGGSFGKRSAQLSPTSALTSIFSFDCSSLFAHTA